MFIIAEVEPHGEREAIRYVSSSRTIQKAGTAYLQPNWTPTRENACRYLSEDDAKRIAESIWLNARQLGQHFCYEIEQVKP